MLAATPYIPQGYPPIGKQWVQFGDPKLDEAFASISHEMHANLSQKKKDWHQMHMDRLQQQSLAPPPDQPPPPPPQHFKIQDPEEEGEDYQDAMSEADEGPSKMHRLAKGIKHVAKDYAWPITRDIVAPAMGDMAVSGLTGAAWLTGKTFWTVWDVLRALGGTQSDGSSGAPALGDGSSHEALGYGGSSSSSSGGSHEEEVKKLSKKSKTALMEEIYTKPGWAHLFGRTDSRGYTKDDKGEWRKKMKDMSQEDLAKILVELESVS